MKKVAFIFDLNGTMIDDMEYHTRAWYDILNNDLKAGLSVEEVKVQMYGKNVELLDRIFGEKHFTPERKNELSVEKERRYQHAYRPELSLIKGLQQFLVLLRMMSSALSLVCLVFLHSSSWMVPPARFWMQMLETL